MKKTLLLSGMLFACIFTASAQYQRRVLVEEFTQASCGPCAGQNPTFNLVLSATESKVTPIKYQTVWPGADPMNAQNKTDVATRVTYYGVTGVPNGFMDGTGITNDCNYYDNAPICLTEDEVDARSGVTSPVEIQLSHVLSADYDSIIISVSVKSDIALSGALRLHVAVVEESINFQTAPGTNGELDFYQVMRKMLPSASGTSTGAFAAGETKTYTFAWPIGYSYDLNQLGASAWLQEDATKEVYNSARSMPTGSVPSAGIKTLNTMNPFVCAAGVSPSFTMKNAGTAAITSALLQYKVGTGAWTNLNWTGNLAPGASEVVTLSNVTISTTGTTKIDIKVVNSNNGVQTNSLDLLSLSIKALLDAPAAIPFVNTFQSASFPPAGWNVSNSGTNGWKLSSGAGSGGSTRSAKNNMFDYANAKTDLISPKVDLTLANSAATLKFDHAYATYDPTYLDSLRIDVSTDCGTTWTTIFHDGSDGLATAPAITTAYTPTASEWASHAIDISSFSGASSVIFRFVAESGYGNNLYIDNVNVTSSVGVKNLDLSSFSMMPNPTSGSTEVRFGLGEAQNIQLMVFNTLGSLVSSRDLGELTSGDHAVSLNALNLTSGTYRVVLQGKDGIAQTQLVVLK